MACDRNQSTVAPAVVSFVAKPGQRYWLMAGVAPMPSTPGSGNLRLSMRVLDIAAPVVTIDLDNAPDYHKVFEYQIRSNDPTASGADPVVAQTNRSKAADAVGARRALHRQPKPTEGHYCVIGSTVRVHWFRIGKNNHVNGTVSATFRDRAGNIGSNTLRTAVRDRAAPILAGNTTARWSRRGRLFVTATCKGGPGRISVQTGANRKAAGNMTFATRETMRMKRVFPKVTRRSTFVHVVCTDRRQLRRHLVVPPR